MDRLTRFAIGLAALAMAAPAAAQMVTAADPSSVADVLRQKGYQAELTATSDGEPMIRSASGGSKFTIFFYNCTDKKACATVQFYAGFDSSEAFPLARINEWNKGKRFGRGYVDGDNDPVVEMDVDLDDGGMSRALFEDNIEFWTSILDDFRKFVFEGAAP